MKSSPDSPETASGWGTEGRTGVGGRGGGRAGGQGKASYGRASKGGDGVPPGEPHTSSDALLATELKTQAGSETHQFC